VAVVIGGVVWRQQRQRGQNFGIRRAAVIQRDQSSLELLWFFV
jgi:hypothetical protein